MKLKDIQVGMAVAYLPYKDAEPQRAIVKRVGLRKVGSSWSSKYVEAAGGKSGTYVELEVERPNGSVTQYAALFTIPGEFEAVHAAWAQRRFEASVYAQRKQEIQAANEARSEALYGRLAALTGFPPLYQGSNPTSFSIRFDELERLLTLAEQAQAGGAK